MTDEPDAAAIAWAGQVVGRPVTGVTQLTGGMTSRMLRLSHDTGDDTVLRLITEEPWRRHGAELARREAETQQSLAASPVPAPHSLALDADGSARRSRRPPHDVAAR